MAVAPGCEGAVYGCPDCGKKEMTIGESIDHSCARSPIHYALQVFGEPQQYTHLPHLTEGLDDLCPACRVHVIGMWADDGEADLADWWECEKSMGGCGAHGAVMLRGAKITQNGLPVPTGRS